MLNMLPLFHDGCGRHMTIELDTNVPATDLKTARENSGLTLKELFERTRISVVNLEAIENGAFHLLPVPLYARNFIKTYAAALGVDSGPVLVRDGPDEAAAAMALIENMQREDLNPLEEAQGLQRLVKEFGLTHEQAAQAVGRSRSAASNLLRLLNLAEPVQTMLMAGDIDMGHARALLALDRAAQITAGNQIAARKLSVREAEALVKKIGAEFNLVATRPKKEKSRDLKRVEEELSDLLMAEVEVRVKKRVKRNGRVEDMGELAIQFGSLEALNGLIDRLRG